MNGPRIFIVRPGGNNLISGTLTVNMDPPFISFVPIDEGCPLTRSCTIEEMRVILVGLGVSNWPLRDCIVRIKSEYTSAQFSKFGFAGQSQPLNFGLRRSRAS